MNKLGIMQGRLTNPRERTDIQFPLYNSDEILNEFEIAKCLGLDYIEWNICKAVPNLFLGNFYAQEAIKSTKEFSEISINSICLDYLMDLDLKDKDLEFATQTINWIANIASNVGCKTIVIPIYRNNMNIHQLKYLISYILEKYNIKITFEFLNSNSSKGVSFLNELEHFGFDDFIKLGCCFDIGNNCLVLGNVETPPQKNYEGIIKEMENYYIHNKLYHIHIKEKNKHGNTVPLGKGIIGKKGWKEIFSFLKDINYNGDYTLQVARGKSGDETNYVKEQIEFIKELM